MFPMGFRFCVQGKNYRNTKNKVRIKKVLFVWVGNLVSI